MQCAILVVGLPGSGKSLFSEAAKKLGLPVISMGDVVRREALRRGLKISSQTLAKLSQELRQERGAAAVAELTLELLPRAPLVVIEGVRSPAEVERFKQCFAAVNVVAIHASPITRYQRLSGRGRADDPSSWEEFVERDRRELSFGIGDVIALADYMIVNENISMDEFIEKCNKILNNIIIKCKLVTNVSDKNSFDF